MIWPTLDHAWIIFTPLILAGLLAALHALFYKRDPRAALGWIGGCLLFPALGVVLYLVFGINRIQAKAGKLQRRFPFSLENTAGKNGGTATGFEHFPLSFAKHAEIVYALTGRALVSGNCVKALFNGEQAFPAMLEAIDHARSTCFLSTYIFDADTIGQRFARALAKARERGVDVRVVLDGVGEFNPLHAGGALLREYGIPMARFLPPRFLPPSMSINLRSHHKILTVDGRVAFTGGINISDRHLMKSDDPSRVQDIHFQLKGPCVGQLEEVFLWDWGFASGRETTPPQSVCAPCGDVICRTVTDGPHDAVDKLPPILIAAIGAARERVCVMTPYFLPTREIVGALRNAALSGVRVDIVLPETSDVMMTHRATRNMLWELLEMDPIGDIEGGGGTDAKNGPGSAKRVHVYYQPKPFSHSKIFMVDNEYALIGSANWDPRSLRLNFECVTEVFDAKLAGQLTEHFDAVKQQARAVTLAEVDNRRFFTRLLDSLCWLFTPYL